MYIIKGDHVGYWHTIYDNNLIKSCTRIRPVVQGDSTNMLSPFFPSTMQLLKICISKLFLNILKTGFSNS